MSRPLLVFAVCIFQALTTSLVSVAQPSADSTGDTLSVPLTANQPSASTRVSWTSEGEEKRALAGHRASPVSNGKKLVCYFGSWSTYRPGRGKFEVENIDPHLCTHYIYTFAGLANNRIKSLDPWQDLRDHGGKGGYERFTGLKKRNQNIKTMIAIGGWNEGSAKYSAMAADAGARATFIASVVEFLKRYGFDGLDLDWEYPAARGGKPQDRGDFTALTRELRAAFNPHGFLLSAAVSAGQWTIDPGYDVPEIARNLDFINVMCYDYHGGWDKKTGLNAPLYSRAAETGRDKSSNVDFSINYWLQKGAPKEKIILGMGTYGRSFTLENAQVNGVGAPALAPGQPGPYTREAGSLGYNEICAAFKRETWTVKVDPEQKAPFAFHDRQWVGYDDIDSITLKTRYALQKDLGGAMIWSIETDDFLGDCGEKYPLLNRINRILFHNAISSILNSALCKECHSTSTNDQPSPINLASNEGVESPLRTSSGSTPVVFWRKFVGGYASRESVTSPSSANGLSKSFSRTIWSSTSSMIPPFYLPMSDDVRCTQEGSFAQARDCHRYYLCVKSGTGRYIRYDYTCSTSTEYDEASRVCVLYQPSHTGCTESSGRKLQHTDDTQLEEKKTLKTAHITSYKSSLNEAELEL